MKTILPCPRPRTFALLLAAVAVMPLAARSQSIGFERIVIDGDFPGGYQVEVADVNGDAKPDLVALGGGTCAWYENPTWTKRIVTTQNQTPGIISSATADLDGDGRAEIAIAYDFEMNKPSRGKLALAIQDPSAEHGWSFIPVAEVGSIHRVRWGDLNGDGTVELVVAPLFGPDALPPDDTTPARLSVFDPGPRPKEGRWTQHPLAERPVVHAIEVRPLSAREARSVILTADNLGVSILGEHPQTNTSPFSLSIRQLVPGAAGPAPRRGCSEIHLGRYRDGRHFLATIEPWHGNEVVVWSSLEAESLQFPHRDPIDQTLADGHALWVADVDQDGDDEIFAGHRGPDHRVSMYDYQPNTRRWTRTVMDRQIAAQDLRGADLDRNGRPDIVAIGGATHNLLWYRPLLPQTP